MDTLTRTSSPSMPSTPAWATALTPQDLDAYGLTCPGVSCVDSLIELAEGDEIDLAAVTACLDLLRAGPYLLAMGAPLIVMAYSPALGGYRAADDGEIDAEPALLNEAQAGLWLTLASSEVHPLPQQPGDWGVLTILRQADGRIDLVGQDSAAIQVYLAHAHVLDQHVVDRHDYDAFISRAVWTCVHHALGSP